MGRGNEELLIQNVALPPLAIQKYYLRSFSKTSTDWLNSRPILWRKGFQTEYVIGRSSLVLLRRPRLVLQRIQIDPTDCKSVFAEIQIDPTGFHEGLSSR